MFIISVAFVLVKFENILYTVMKEFRLSLLSYRMTFRKEVRSNSYHTMCVYARKKNERQMQIGRRSECNMMLR